MQASAPSRLPLADDQRGAIFVECLIAYLPCLYFALCVWQLAELCAGQLLVQRAANAAVRAAVVVLPDNTKLYGDDASLKQLDIELAAALVLASDPNFLRKPKVTLNGEDTFSKLDNTYRRSDSTKLLDKLFGWASIQQPHRALDFFANGANETGLIHEPITARVETLFECYVPWINVVCGGASAELAAEAVLPFQGAAYNY